MLVSRDFDDGERPGRQPTGCRKRRQRHAGKTTSVRRIEKRHDARGDCARRMGSVTGQDAGTSALRESFNVVLQNGQSIAILFDENGLGSAARQRLEATSTGPGKGIELGPVSEWDPTSSELPMRQNIEQRLARPVAGRPNLPAGWR